MMSDYTQLTIRLDTYLCEDAYWVDDYFGAHRYGVRFSDGKVLREDDCIGVNPAMITEFEDKPREPPSNEPIVYVMPCNGGRQHFVMKDGRPCPVTHTGRESKRCRKSFWERYELWVSNKPKHYMRICLLNTNCDASPED